MVAQGEGKVKVKCLVLRCFISKFNMLQECCLCINAGQIHFTTLLNELDIAVPPYSAARTMKGAVTGSAGRSGPTAMRPFCPRRFQHPLAIP